VPRRQPRYRMDTTSIPTGAVASLSLWERLYPGVRVRQPLAGPSSCATLTRAARRTHGTAFAPARAADPVTPPPPPASPPARRRACQSTP
jgi:hypothetical protein